jgi:hypothetical protein
MCYYPKLRDGSPPPDRKTMQAQRLKSLVEAGNYRPKPALIAEAMLRSHGVRELFGEEPVEINPIGQSRRQKEPGPRAA